MTFQRVLVLTCLAVGIAVATGHFFKGVNASSGKQTHFQLENLRGKKNIIDIAVIGSGPAGWEAAFYGAREGKRVLVLTGPEPGGQLTKTTFVDNWIGSKRILGSKIIENLENRARAFGAEAINDTLTHLDVSQWPYVLHTEDDRTIYALTVIVATGASPRKLSIPGEKEVLGEEEYWGRGVTTCALCDAPFYGGKKAVIVGGGDSAAEEALQVSVYAREVVILVRGPKMRASHAMKKRLEAVPSISIKYNVTVEKVVGNGEKVTAVELKDHANNKAETVTTDGVFLAIGHIPNTQIFKNVLAMDSQGYLTVKDRTQETSVEGVFAAGDVEDNYYRQAVVAGSSGLKAAVDAGKLLREIGFNNQVAETLERRNAYFEDFSHENVTIKDLTTLDELNKGIKQSKVVVVDFWAEYCPECKKMLPVVQSMAQRYIDRVMFYKVDANNETAKEDMINRLQVPKASLVPEGKRSIAVQTKGVNTHEMLHLVPKLPCLLIYKDGQLVAQYLTSLTRSELSAAIEEVIGEHEAESAP